MTDRARIESVDNPKIKAAAKLRDRRARKKTGQFLVEGRREIVRALDAGSAPFTLFVEAEAAHHAEARRIARRVEENGGRVFEVALPAYKKMAVRDETDGLLGVFPVPKHDPNDLRLGRKALVLAASGIEKPGNLGALLRSADAFGVDALVVEGGTDLWNPNVVRASLGCLFTVPLAAVPAGGLLPWLSKRKLPIVAASLDGTATPDEVDLRKAVAIVVGSEEKGLDEGILAAADHRVRIPMRGDVDSLNVSVSAGVLLYEAGRQRRGKA